MRTFVSLRLRRAQSSRRTMKKGRTIRLILVAAFGLVVLLAVPAVGAQSAALSVSPTSLDFGPVAVGSRAKLSFEITNAGDEALQWQAHEAIKWAYMYPRAGRLRAGDSATVWVIARPNPRTLLGENFGTIEIRTKAGETATVEVSIEVMEREAAPWLGVSPRALNFRTASEASKSFRIFNTGHRDSTLSGTITTSHSWLSVEPTSWSGNTQTVKVTVDATDLESGRYRGSVTAESNGGTKSVRVYLNVP
ncbi:MAG: hypothetical protein ACE5NP_08205 [Anaerolineae bacterium]